MAATFQKFWNKFVWETRGVNLEDPKQKIDGVALDELFGGPSSKSGVKVNQENALTVSALWRGIAVLGGAASSIPFKIFKKSSNGRTEVDLSELPAVRITKRPNPKMSWKVWVDRIINHMHFRGNHYAKIIRNDLGQAIELQMLNPDKVTVYEDVREVYYKIEGDEKVYRSADIIHVPHLGDGIVGKGVIKYAKEDLGLEISRRDYGSEVYNSGARPPAILTPKTPISDPDRKNAQAAWDSIKRKGKDVMMPFGIDYEPMSFKPEEVEFLQAGNFSVTTIARWLGVPPHKLYDLSRATFSNIEHMAIEFLQDTIAPILVKIEAEYSYKLFQLPIEDKRGYYCEFNMNAYVRADLITRSNAMATQVHAALLTPSEGRSMENREFIEGSNRLFINQGSAPLNLIDDIAKSKRPVTQEQKEKLKELLNGKTEEALKILQ